ncbi:hypothetical protein [Schumannella soli]|uniref:Uncharacterized protein n=1 Tax=Schumannella soli TaxID=2590779 RepID=A0A506Y1N3_9MICO|nr:hypothetical protein [Schumannella soli]TPW75803.1 hypothetical protein FJ657_08040 [Schumannella soli]
MTSDSDFVVRYDEAQQAAVEQTLRRLMRKQGILLIALAVVVGLLGAVPFGALSIAAGDIDVRLFVGVISLLVVPVALGVLGVRQLRRRLRTPEFAVVIAPGAVRFPALDRPSAFLPRIRAEEWEREGTSAEIVSASGLQAARVEFTRLDSGRSRRRSIAADTIDVDPRVIVDALRSAPTS